MPVFRSGLALWTIAVLGVTLTGCTGSGDPPARTTSRTIARPTVVGQHTLPPLIPRVTPSDDNRPPVQTAAQRLSDRISRALVAVGDAEPSTRLSLRPAAGNQLQVAWVAGTAWPDPLAGLRVRRQVLRILAVTRGSAVPFGSVLLLATGPTWVAGSTAKKKTSIVVRAKYSHHLVENTAWRTVAPGDVLRMCDDKPAVVAVGYR